MWIIAEERHLMNFWIFFKALFNILVPIQKEYSLRKQTKQQRK
jgi:hypothetical protein